MTRDLSKSIAGLLAAIFGLCGFAVAQPLFDVLGRGSAFFAAHHADRTDVIAFTVFVLVVPAAAVSVLLVLLYHFARSRFLAVIPLLFGFMTSLVVVPHVDRAWPLSAWAFVLLQLGVWAASFELFKRSSSAQLFLRAIGFAPLLFAVMFLLFSPVSAFVLPKEKAPSATALSSTTNVVLVILDELPLGALITRSGEIDAQRFPGFARLAAQSTWYRKATTITPWTYLAVPSLLTGAVPRADAAPIEANHQHNVFKLLASSHSLHAHESVTSICGGDCGKENVDWWGMLRDSVTVFLHGFLPGELEDRWLPEINNSWRDFDQARPLSGRDERVTVSAWAKDRAAKPMEKKRDSVAAFRAFVNSIERPPATRPGLWVGHFLLPHFPFHYLRDGQQYDDSTVIPPGLSSEDALTWSDHRPLVEAVRQRFVLQTQFVDGLIGELLDRLSEQGLSNDVLLIVAADHGLSFAPGSTRRGTPLTEASASEVLPVPLFVRYPQQVRGRVDDLPRQTIDVVPTIVDSLGISLPQGWRFDGQSLRGTGTGEPRWLPADGGVKPPNDPDVTRAASGYFEQFGEARARHDIYAFGPFADLVGRSVEAVNMDISTAELSKVRLHTKGLQDFDPRAYVVPSLTRFTLEWAGPRKGDWLAIAINGVVGGLGPIYQESGSTSAMAMADPTLLRAGSNNIAAYIVTANGDLVPTVMK